ncbi:hypothetical protein GOB93_00295 [Acetobacter musti]|uniref:Transposase n=1 Tax=Acetobacter musti TaxID=864732 RepID=A0ABX0JJP9_9PROT|nr:hypothetical protein [Acetobacter musti]
MSGIVCVIRNGLQWKDTLQACDPHKSLHNASSAGAVRGVFDRIFTALTERAGRSKRLMTDATHLRAPGIQRPLCSEREFSHHPGRTKGGLNSKLHAMYDGQGRACIPPGKN